MWLLGRSNGQQHFHLVDVQRKFALKLSATLVFWNLWSCGRSLATANRMQQVGILLAGTLDKVNKHSLFIYLFFIFRSPLLVGNSHPPSLVGNKLLPDVFCSWAMTSQRHRWVWGTARCALQWRRPTLPGPFSSSSRGSIEQRVFFKNAPAGAMLSQLWKTNMKR